MLHLTLRQIQVFVAVAHAGSTTAAGKVAALSQSAVSNSLSELERMLGMQLFDRTGKRLVLNDNGRTLLPRALSLLDQAAGISQLGLHEEESLQQLRIGTSTTIGNYLLPDLLSNLYSRVIGLASPWSSRVSIGNTAAICREVAELQLDVALVEGPCNDPRLQATPWLRDELLVVAAPHHPLAAHGTLTGPDALRSAVWLLREPGSGTREEVAAQLKSQLQPFTRILEIGSSEAIKHAAARGLGLAILSRWVVQDLLDAHRLRVLQTTLQPMSRQCWCVLHRDKLVTPAMETFLALIRSVAMPRQPPQSEISPGNSAYQSIE